MRVCVREDEAIHANGEHRILPKYSETQLCATEKEQRSKITSLMILIKTQNWHSDLIRHSLFCHAGAHDLLSFQGKFTELQAACPQGFPYFNQQLQNHVYLHKKRINVQCFVYNTTVYQATVEMCPSVIKKTTPVRFGLLVPP